jgi:hypothetical protein
MAILKFFFPLSLSGYKKLKKLQNHVIYDFRQ